MGTTTDPTPGTVLPLPHLGAGRRGLVVESGWSEYLGTVLTVEEQSNLGLRARILLYGDNLQDALGASSTLAA